MKTGTQQNIENEIFERGYAKSTAKAYSQIISDLAKFYSTEFPLELTAEEISRYISHECKIGKKKPNTLNVIHSAATLYFNKLHRKNFHFDFKKIPDKERRKVNVPTIEDIRKLFEAAENLRSKAIIGLVYGCGLEMGEVINLKHDDINPEENTIFLKSNKTKKIRKTYISAPLLNLLNQYYKAYKPIIWLFEGRVPGKQLPSRSIQNYVKRPAIRAGLTEDFNLILLKYCHVKHSEQLGIPLSVILKRLKVTHKSNYQFYTSLGSANSNSYLISPFDKLEDPDATTFVNDTDGFWNILNPKIKNLAQRKFDNNFYADSVETCLKELNSNVKSIVKNELGKEYDGSELMNRAFSLKEPIIKLADLSTESGQNVQKGYIQIFAGVMTGIRNPKTHQNISIDRKTAIHLLFLCSQLFNMLENGSH